MAHNTKYENLLAIDPKFVFCSQLNAKYLLDLTNANNDFQSGIVKTMDEIRLGKRNGSMFVLYMMMDDGPWREAKLY